MRLLVILGYTAFLIFASISVYSDSDNYHNENTIGLGIGNSIRNAKTIKIYYDSQVYESALPIPKYLIQERSNTVIEIRCVSTCLNTYPKIIELFESNTYTRSTCGKDVSAFIAIQSDTISTKIEGIYISASGKCISVNGEDYQLSNQISGRILLGELYKTKKWWEHSGNIDSVRRK